MDAVVGGATSYYVPRGINGPVITLSNTTHPPTHSGLDVNVERPGVVAVVDMRKVTFVMSTTAITPSPHLALLTVHLCRSFLCKLVWCQFIGLPRVSCSNLGFGGDEATICRWVTPLNIVASSPPNPAPAFSCASNLSVVTRRAVGHHAFVHGRSF